MYHTHLPFIDYSHVSRVIREQWIRAKYERKEFLAEAADDDRTYTTGQVAVCVCVCVGGGASHHLRSDYLQYAKTEGKGPGPFHEWLQCLPRWTEWGRGSQLKEL